MLRNKGTSRVRKKKKKKKRAIETKLCCVNQIWTMATTCFPKSIIFMRMSARAVCHAVSVRACYNVPCAYVHLIPWHFVEGHIYVPVIELRRVCNHTIDVKVGRLRSGSPICLSRVWLQTELDDTESHYQSIIKMTISDKRRTSRLWKKSKTFALKDWQRRRKLFNCLIVWLTHWPVR